MTADIDVTLLTFAVVMLLYVIISCAMVAAGLGLFASAMVARRSQGRHDAGVARHAIGIVLMAVPTAIWSFLLVIDSIPNPFPGP